MSISIKDSELYAKIAKILRTSPQVLLDLDAKMSAITGQEGVIVDIAKENDVLVERTLEELGLTRESSAEEVFSAFVDRLAHLDKHLHELLDKPDLTKMSVMCGKLCEAAFQVYTPPRGLFIKREKAIELLEKYKPENLCEYFGYSSAHELIDKEGFASVVGALRFTQSSEWMHKFFEDAYSDLKPEDFEERAVELKVLDTKWLDVADKFLKKKYNNVSHLKEYGVIFIIPLKIDTPGETVRLFTLILHYLHEVPFYSSLFRKYFNDPDFSSKFKSLLRGDVSEGPLPDGGKVSWRIVQRYLAKDDIKDPRLVEPHVNPEAEHWFRAEDDLNRLSRMFQEVGRLNLGYWKGLDFVGDFFKDKNGEDKLVSFDLIDIIMSVVQKGEVKYLYHQQEALWNKIFVEYLGREKMNQLIEENIINGFIIL